MKKYIYLSLIAFTLLACSQKANYEKSFSNVVGNGDHSFRSFNLGDNYDTVLDKENAEIIDYVDSIQIRCKIMDSDTETYQITYIFDENALLDAVRYDAYIGTIQDGEKLTNMFVDFFNQKYGLTSESKGFYTWTKNNESVELVDDSEVYGYGKVTLIIFHPHVNASDTLAI